MTTRIRTRHVNVSDAAPVIADREPFMAGNLSGAFLPESGPRPSGALPSAYLNAWWQAGTAHQSAVYVVYSYSTPIAWVTPDGTATIPDVTYSLTTTQHQYTVRHAAQLAGWTVAPNPVPRISLLKGRGKAGAFGSRSGNY